ncbi:hypothetical protein RN607_11390 [Demequina capsici]|uniref:DUF4190 domain-containing protein n=1 Tax=Demequina capsici TaxID=3075620 RepID=A0AA96F8J0_9MICO|nr:MULTISPECIES: hypothetical protein [unclassified Demequina]WNM23966.1 hypothetical protein RN606_11450 [Demequina sp. OYTSA14]WNM26794.1 hypothetical protein RN607_11390 [Demequina sp. PMTSA13]
MPDPNPAAQPPQTPAQRWSRALSVLVLGLALLLLLGFPWTLGALVLGPVTIVAGIIALTSRGAADLRGWSRANAIVGVVLGGLSAMSAAGMLLLFQPLNDLASCNSRAITNSARQQCQTDFDQAYQDLLHRYGVELPSAG